MKKLSRLLFLALGLAAASVHAAMVESHAFPGLGLAVPDGDPSGVASLRNVDSAILSIEEVSVTVNVSGAFNGDLYAYLQHDTGLAVLLNRVGRTSSSPFGFGDDGFQVTFNDAGGFPDIHTVGSGSGGAVTGSYSADGRATDPDFVLNTDLRTAGLDTLQGLDANGAWTLFVADLSGGDSHTVESWSLEITGVPEPGVYALLALGAGLLGHRRRR